ncbi:hypothetical protein [Roseovarius rhodophyticola]|uniref:Secreted protein n=1 Tax=Roseovarius rhodophyticola TaxID=3080827 RepID=A0ABZ2TQ03_9RHOB|nr:hypothetical protein [Roseovarius sp. W115]
MLIRVACVFILMCLAPPVLAEDAAKDLDCSDIRDASLSECLDLPDADEPITNFAPVVAPIAGVAAALGGVLGAGGSSPSTTSTSTTGTQ